MINDIGLQTHDRMNDLVRAGVANKIWSYGP